MCYHKECEDLAQKVVEGNPKVVIVSLLTLNHLSSGLCNHDNIVSGVQLDWRETA